MSSRWPIVICVVLMLAGNLTLATRARSEPATSMPWIKVSADKTHFVHDSGDERFVPVGFNYDHDESGRLIEDYWHDEWEKVAADFAEMKQLGATVVRVHLQLGKFMQSETEANQDQLARLAKLLELAERTGIYLNLTGLGCYHKDDVPKWYDALDEADRWAVQARFWRAVATQCADSPAVFCYDLMNEPVVPGNDDHPNWLGPGFGGKHFVQFISRKRADRERPEIAKAWIAQLVKAIREVDQRHLITVGLVDWSLARPGLTSGFVPDKVAGKLDFICVHLYPESGKVDEALETLQGFAIGKPVVIEETFPLKCSQAEFERFLKESQATASGWITFYWGATPDELEKAGTIQAAMQRAALKTFERELAILPRKQEPQ